MNFSCISLKWPKKAPTNIRNKVSFFLSGCVGSVCFFMRKAILFSGPWFRSENKKKYTKSRVIDWQSNKLFCVHEFLCNNTHPSAHCGYIEGFLNETRQKKYTDHYNYEFLVIETLLTARTNSPRSIQIIWALFHPLISTFAAIVRVYYVSNCPHVFRLKLTLFNNKRKKKFRVIFRKCQWEVKNERKKYDSIVIAVINMNKCAGNVHNRFTIHGPSITIFVDLLQV